MVGGEGIENTVWDHDLEVKAKDRQTLFLKEIRDEYRSPQWLASYLTQKRCIQIKNKDALCCVRAIVRARARLDHHPKWNNIRRGRREQLLLARQLHFDAGNDSLSLTLYGTICMFTHTHTH